MSGGNRQDSSPAPPHGDLAKLLAELEDKTEALAMNHDTFSRNTRNQLKQVFDALRELKTPPDPPKRPIGFINPEDMGSTKTGGRARLDLTPAPCDPGACDPLCDHGPRCVCVSKEVIEQWRCGSRPISGLGQPQLSRVDRPRALPRR